MPGKKKSTATRSAPRRKSTTVGPTRRKKRKAATTKYGPGRFALEIETGALFGLDADGIQRDPVACGVHRSAAVHESSTDDEDEKAEGFDPKCDDCVAQAESTAAYADQHHTV
jgi:hypothetical protein